MLIIPINIITNVSHSIKYIDFCSIVRFLISNFVYKSIPSSINDVSEYIIIVASPIDASFRYFLNSSNVLFLFFMKNSIDILIANI